MKRKYTKKSNYWQEKSTASRSSQESVETLINSFTPKKLGDPFYVASASRVKSANSTKYRENAQSKSPISDRFSSIRDGLLPYSYSTDGVDIKDAIELCQKAYANVSIFRNAIDVLADMANSDIFLEGGSAKSRAFFEEWFKKIKLHQTKDQFFREYYRGGNVFFYRFDSTFKFEDYAKIITSISDSAPKENKIPIRYLLLNPCSIILDPTVGIGTPSYSKVLTNFERKALAAPKTEEEKAFVESLDEDIKKGLNKGGINKGGSISIKLESDRLSSIFYRKQDYEPFAVPFGFPVLDDINAKMELKKMDQAITRTVENVILLITMGEEIDKGGVNPKALEAMQGLFENESVGRVLVSDYTTKANFIIPDLNKVLGSEKYKTLNEDIRQGLQNIIVGEEKYSSTEIKADIFIERLKGAREAFINDFLQPEIKRVANALGFKAYPTVKFKDLDMRDQTQLMRVVTRLIELGILTPEQGMEMFDKGTFPTSKELQASQEEYVKLRKKGYYNPIVGGIPFISPPNQPKQDGEEPKVKIHGMAGRPEGTTGIPLSTSEASFSIKNITQVLRDEKKLGEDISSMLKKQTATASLSETQIGLVDKLCKTILVSTKKENWLEVAESCVKDFSVIAELKPMDEILQLVEEYELNDDYQGALLLHSL